MFYGVLLGKKSAVTLHGEPMKPAPCVAFALEPIVPYSWGVVQPGTLRLARAIIYHASNCYFAQVYGEDFADRVVSKLDPLSWQMATTVVTRWLACSVLLGWARAHETHASVRVRRIAVEESLTTNKGV